MKRNRKREPLRFGTVAKSLCVCVCIAGIGLGYVWQKTQVYRIGDEIKKRETTLLATQKRNSMLAAQVAHLKSPAQLEARCQQQGLALVAPREDQVVRVYEPGPEWDAPATIPAQVQPKHNNTQPKTVAQR